MLKKEIEKQLLSEMNHMYRIMYLASCIIISSSSSSISISIKVLLYVSVTATHFCGC